MLRAKARAKADPLRGDNKKGKCNGNRVGKNFGTGFSALGLALGHLRSKANDGLRFGGEGWLFDGVTYAALWLTLIFSFSSMMFAAVSRPSI